MDVQKLLSTAWQAVEQSGIPQELHEVALKEAISYLRSGSSAPPHMRDQPGDRAGERQDEGGSGERRGGDSPSGEDAFFQQLAHESGVAEADLRDVLNLRQDGSVIVTVPTKDLGTSTAEQARTVTALVAGARSKGLGEKPVDADAVRAEVKRKGCFDQNNYASKSLGALKGFNSGANKKEIVLTSKWVSDFVSAVNRATGREAGESAK
ncbi:MAG TPA: hypothetical protein VGX28_02090 [Frankiaceae bacterium]|jgi:hypothetical protein|nr:hypothetical protein [Frankiaceae bacterium]